MARKRKDNSPINENWVKAETKKDWQKSAVQTLAAAKKFESEHEFKAVRVDKKTVILKKVK